MMHIAICDDSPLDLEQTCRTVEAVMPLEAQVKAFSVPAGLLAQVERGWTPTIAILDIQMASMDGICLAKELNVRCPDCQIIFLTDYLEYATDVYDVRHSYFILKSQLAQRIGPALIRALEELPRIPSLCFREKGELHRVNRDSVLYLERRLRKTYLYGNTICYETYEHPRTVLADAVDDSFCQCHQSFWVNLNRVSSLAEDHFRMDNGADVPISRSFQKHVKAQFFAFLHRVISVPAENGKG